MNRDNISALVMAITVVGVSVIVGFTVYFINPSLNQAWSVQQQQQQKDKGLVIGSGVHSPEFQLEKNYTKMKSAVQSGINHPVIAAGMGQENHTMTTTTMKFDTAQFKQIDKSQFVKAPEFAQISGYINTPNNNSPITLSSLNIMNNNLVTNEERFRVLLIALSTLNRYDKGCYTSSLSGKTCTNFW